MRFDVPLSSPRPVADTSEISPKAPVGPVRRVGEGTRGVSARIGGGAGEPVDTESMPVAAWQGEERRLMCRRIYHLPVLLDTRSGMERRQAGDGASATATHMDRQA